MGHTYDALIDMSGGIQEYISTQLLNYSLKTFY